ncbi:hypothetical protein [uncultured Agathobaculum sp.]|uniref:hypothetical protein n=1 Tax=uncultured Agathobaculum sp. TaxID=2048140 RepID=UPI00296E37E0
MKAICKNIAAGLLLAAVLAWFLSALANVSDSESAESRQQLESAIRRAAVACYAAEGVYPPTLDYLEQHYGIQVDETRYMVSYDIFASNLMPEITVLDLKA